MTGVCAPAVQLPEVEVPPLDEDDEPVLELLELEDELELVPLLDDEELELDVLELLALSVEPAPEPEEDELLELESLLEPELALEELESEVPVDAALDDVPDAPALWLAVDPLEPAAMVGGVRPVGGASADDMQPVAKASTANERTRNAPRRSIRFDQPCSHPKGSLAVAVQRSHPGLWKVIGVDVAGVCNLRRAWATSGRAIDVRATKDTGRNRDFQGSHRERADRSVPGACGLCHLAGDSGVEHDHRERRSGQL